MQKSGHSKRSLRIPRVLCQKLPSLHHPIPIDSDEAAHLQQSLRLRDGDPVIAIDGRGSAIDARFFIRDRKPWLEMAENAEIQHRKADNELSPITLEMSVIKGDSMSWVIEKAVELGARNIVPVLSDHAVVQVDKKGAEHFVERWQRIADQALKQCERLNRLTILPPQSVSELFRQKTPSKRFVAIEPRVRQEWNERAEHLTRDFFRAHVSLHILIGPEGGWSAQELQLFQVEARQSHLGFLDFGPLVLRAETAALYALSCGLSARGTP